jgi:hypothetical protein
VRLSPDYPSLPDAVEITRPWSDEVRWLVWRGVDGVLLDELATQELSCPRTMLEVLAAAGEIMAGERASAMAAMTGSSGVPVGDLLANLKGARRRR